MSGWELVGHAPEVRIEPANPERAKYERMWAEPAYREHSPGEGWAIAFLAQARPPADAEAIDFGCGTGRGGLALALLGSLRVRLIDFAANCLDEEVAAACVTQPERLRFDAADLTRAIPWSAPFGFCCDVMEHVAPDDVDRVLANVLGSAERAFFAISTEPDRMGALIGEPLHLTVRPAAWWADRLRAAGAVILWADERPGVAVFYVSAWRGAAEVLPEGRLNADEAEVEAQTLANIAAGWDHVRPHDRQDREVVLLAGGPSMLAGLDEIRALRAGGAALVTMNGAYGWAIENGLEPSAQIVLDARAFNARFVRPLVDRCRYLIASQAHPETLAGLPRERTLLWHSGVSAAAEALCVERAGFFFPIPGGSTVALRAIPLLRMLGFARIRVFGLDSCVDGAAHHAYAQPENDGEALLPVSCGGRTFSCSPWMLRQALDFIDLVPLLGDEVELAIAGDGLIAHIVATGASLSDLEGIA